MKRLALLILCGLMASGAVSQTVENSPQERAISLGTVQNGRLNLPLQTLVQNLDSQPQTRVFHLDWTYQWGQRRIFSHASYDRVLKNLTFEQHGQLGDFLRREHFVVAPISRENLGVAARWPNTDAKSLVMDAYFGSLQSAFGVKRRDIVPTTSEILRDFEPTSVDGLQLEIFLAPDQKPRVGEPLALRFRLKNNSNAPKSAITTGSCRTVHAASFAVISPQNALSQNNNRGLVGGPHCFCNQKEEVLAPGATVELQNATQNPDLVMTFRPHKTGKYTAVGIYALPDAKRLISRPLEFEIVSGAPVVGEKPKPGSF